MSFKEQDMIFLNNGLNTTQAMAVNLKGFDHTSLLVMFYMYSYRVGVWYDVIYRMADCLNRCRDNKQLVITDDTKIYFQLSTSQNNEIGRYLWALGFNMERPVQGNEGSFIFTWSISVGKFRSDIIPDVFPGVEKFPVDFDMTTRLGQYIGQMLESDWSNFDCVKMKAAYGSQVIDKITDEDAFIKELRKRRRISRHYVIRLGNYMPLIDDIVNPKYRIYANGNK